MQDPKRYTITAALPYTNGPVHIGHLAGVYVPADIYARYLRLNGKEVAFVCGSDEHGVPITLKAKAEGVSPQAVVDKYHEIIKNLFRNSELLLIIIRELRQKYITKRQVNSLRTYMNTINLLRKHPHNYMMKRLINF